MASTPHHHRFFGRTLARCQALQILFQAEACDRAVDDVLAGDYVISQGPLDEYAERLARGVGEHVLELDDVLSNTARNWSLSRMSSTDRNLLRIALYEILHVDEVDPSVAISECVELAKGFGSSDDSSRFVNGVLGSVMKQIDAGVDVAGEARRRVAAEYGLEGEGEAAAQDAAATDAPVDDADADADDVPADAAAGADVAADDEAPADVATGADVPARPIDAPTPDAPAPDADERV